MTAIFSTKSADEKKAERLAAVLAERKDLFGKFHAGGWEIDVVQIETKDRQWHFLKDNYPGQDCQFRVKPPGAAPLRAKNVAQLLRLVGGV